MSTSAPKLSFAFKPPTGRALPGGGGPIKAPTGAGSAGMKLGAGSRGIAGFGMAGQSKVVGLGGPKFGTKTKASVSGKSSTLGFGSDEDDEEDGTSTPGAGPSRQPGSKASGMISKPPPTSSSSIRKPLPFASLTQSSPSGPSIYDDLTPTPITTPTLNPTPTAHQLSRQARKAQEEALKIDSTVFEYDEVYDGIQTARERVKEVERLEGEERKPKYIEAFLSSAQTRRLDRLRAEDKMTQLSRDKEALENPDWEGKDSFVTPGFLKQMEEVKRVEEERRLEEKERLSRKGPGMTSFYSNMLAQSEAEHAAAIEATSSSTPMAHGLSGAGKTISAAAGPSLAIRPPTTASVGGMAGTLAALRSETDKDRKQKPAIAQQYDYDPEAEADSWLIREAAAANRQAELLAAATTTVPVVEKLPGGVSTEGEKVEINDEGAIVDKRVLLKAGLNITKKPIAVLPSLGTKARAEAEIRYQSRAVGSSASYAERNARERERLARMIAEEAERDQKRKEKEAQEASEKALKRRQGGDEREEGDLKRRAAKERFEERKRRKVEEEAEAAKQAALEGAKDTQ